MRSFAKSPICIWIGITFCLLAFGFCPGCKEKLDPLPVDHSPEFIAYARGQVDVEGGIVRLYGFHHGEVRRVEAKVGEAVRVGQILASFDDHLEQLELAGARAAVELARARLEPIRVHLSAAERDSSRLAPLVRSATAAQADFDKISDIIAETKAELDVANAGVDAATAQLQISIYALEQCTLRSTVNGVVVGQNVREGNSALQEILPLFLIAPTGRRIVRAYFEDESAERLKAGMDAEIVVTGDPERTLPARLIKIGLISGPKPSTGESDERVDERGVECSFSFDDSSVRLGRQVLVRVKP